MQICILISATVSTAVKFVASEIGKFAEYWVPGSLTSQERPGRMRVVGGCIPCGEGLGGAEGRSGARGGGINRQFRPLVHAREGLEALSRTLYNLGGCGGAGAREGVPAAKELDDFIPFCLARARGGAR